MAATAEEILRVRLDIDEPTSTVFDDDMITSIITEADNDLLTAAALLWGYKAARFAGLVDTSESGSSRSMSQLYKNAMAMQANFEKRAKADVTVVEEAEARPRTRTAVRK